jgi:replicative DNA helicase
LLETVSEDQSVSGPLDLEQELLDHLTDFDSLRFLIQDGFSDELLNYPNNKAVYQFARHYFRSNGTSPTVEVLRTEFPKLELYNTSAAIEWVVEKLRERFQRNRVQDVTRKLAKLANDPAAALSFLREQTIEIERKSVTSKIIWTPDDIEEFIARMKEKILQGQFRGHSFGFKEVDDFTGGNKPGYLAGLAARPKRQKTFYAIQSFIANVVAGRSTVFFALENTQDEIILRASCMLSGIPWDRAQRGELMPDDTKKILQAWDLFSAEGNAFIIRPDPGERTVHDLLILADKVEAENVIVSQFKYVEPSSDRYRSEQEKWGSIVLDLKLAATAPGKERPWYVETQLNREAQSMTEMQDADLAQLGLTDMWGQACDIMFCLFQNRDLRSSGLTEFGIIEARNSDKAAWLVHSEFKNGTELKIV